MSLEKDLKKVIPASKELRQYMERLKNKPAPQPERIERQLRASGAFVEKLRSEIRAERERKQRDA